MAQTAMLGGVDSNWREVSVSGQLTVLVSPCKMRNRYSIRPTPS